jgi:transposase
MDTRERTNQNHTRAENGRSLSSESSFINRFQYVADIRAVRDQVKSQVEKSQAGIYEGVFVRLTYGGCLPAPYSQDLRIRVASALSGGSSPRKAADRFGIGIGTAILWAQRLQTEGHVEARAMGGDQRSRLSEHRDVVLTLIAHQPDLTLEEIRSALIERHGITVGRGTVWRFLKAHFGSASKLRP